MLHEFFQRKAMKVIIGGRDKQKENRISVRSPVKQDVGLLSGTRMVAMHLHYGHVVVISVESWLKYWRLAPSEVIFAQGVKFTLFTKVKPTLVFGHGEELAVAFINDLQLIHMRVIFLVLFLKWVTFIRH